MNCVFELKSRLFESFGYLHDVVPLCDPFNEPLCDPFNELYKWLYITYGQDNAYVRVESGGGACFRFTDV